MTNSLVKLVTRTVQRGANKRHRRDNEKVSLSMPELSDDEMSKAFESTDKTSGSGGPDLIASQAARIVEVYQNKFNTKLV